jgi:hypothetical protein
VCSPINDERVFCRFSLGIESNTVTIQPSNRYHGHSYLDPDFNAVDRAIGRLEMTFHSIASSDSR